MIVNLSAEIKTILDFSMADKGRALGSQPWNLGLDPRHGRLRMSSSQ